MIRHLFRSPNTEKISFERLVVIRKFTKQPIDRAERKSIIDKESVMDFLFVSPSKIYVGGIKEYSTPVPS